jgi:hypothetical protein
MSEDRQVLPSGALDQTARSHQAESHDEDLHVQTEEEAIEAARLRVEELEHADREKERKLAEASRRATDAESRAAESERRAREAESRAAHATNTGQRTADEARLGEIKTALVARKEQLTSLETQYSAAFTAGDGAAMAKIQGQMSLVGPQIVNLESGQTALEQRIEAQKQQPPQPSVDEYRRNFVNSQPPRVQEWLRANGDRYWSDQAFQDQVAAVANYAQKVKRISIDSQEYVDYVNEEMGLVEPKPPKPTTSDRRDSAPAVSGGRDADGDTGRRMVAAPAGGAVPGTSSAARGGGEAVYLTRGEKEIADSMGVSYEEYARHKRDLTREGLIGPRARR